jgi:cobaltochelatase CobS
MKDKDQLLSLIPSLDTNYSLDQGLTKIIEAAIKNNLKVLIHGPHGSGKSTHIEQICARLKLPTIRVNLDTNISRADLVGKDSIVMSEGKQVIAFKEGLLPYALRHGLVLILDEYDAARPETLFVLQKILEKNGKLFLFEEGTEITPHPNFRIFATANTIGLGDDSGFYSGTQVINQSNLDRFDIVAKLDYLDYDAELELVKKYHGNLDAKILPLCVRLANLIRAAVLHGDLSVNFSTRTLFAFCKNLEIFTDPHLCFNISYANRLSDADETTIAKDLFTKCFGE